MSRTDDRIEIAVFEAAVLRVTDLEAALLEIIHAAAYEPNPDVLAKTIARHRHLVGAEPT